MSKKSTSLKEALKPLAIWDSEPSLRFEEIAPSLQGNTLGFFGELALDFSLVLRGAMSLQLLAESLLLLGMVVFVVLPTHSSVNVAAAAQCAPHTENPVGLTSLRVRDAMATTKLPVHSLSLRGRRTAKNDSSIEIRGIGQPPTMDEENSKPIEVHSESTLIEIVPSRELVVAPMLVSSSNVQNTLRPTALRTELPQLVEESRLTFGIHSQFASIPAEHGVVGKALVELEYSAGYNFNVYHQIALTYSKQTFRQLASTLHSILVINVSTGQSHMVQTFTYTALDHALDVPGLSYTFHVNNLSTFGIEPFVSAFGGVTSAGILWRATGGLDWQPVEHISFVGSYAWEELNTNAYSASQCKRGYLNVGLDYHW
jgi:hypothetical protein